MTCRFLGIETDLVVNGVGHELRTFGQRFDLPDDLVERELRAPQGCPFLPDMIFREFEFTDEELNRYAYTDSHTEASPTFLAKKSQALAALAAMRAPH